MKVVWSARALAELEAIHDYITRDNRRAAANIMSSIRSTAADLGSFPYLGLSTDLPGYYTKLVTGTPYRMFYRLTQSEVRVVRVRHVRGRPLRDPR